VFVLDGDAIRDSDIAGLIGEEYEVWSDRWDRAAALVDDFVLRSTPARDELSAAARDAELDDFLELSYEQLLASSVGDERGRRLLAPTLPIRSNRPGSPLAYAYFRTERLRAKRYQGIPITGMRAVADAFAAAADLAGVEFELGVEVTRLRGDRVEANGRSVRARAVLSCLDPARTASLTGYSVAFDSEPSGTKVHVALGEEPELSALGDSVAYLLEPEGVIEVQPHGGNRLSLYLPFGRPDPETALERARRWIPNLHGRVVVHGPRELEQRLGLTGGSIHHGTQGPLDRPGPESPVRGLFLCGAGTHPGGEVSGVPGWHAAQAVRRIL
jgi:phytoene dehydrogenase-like protein